MPLSQTRENLVFAKKARGGVSVYMCETVCSRLPCCRLPVAGRSLGGHSVTRAPDPPPSHVDHSQRKIPAGFSFLTDGFLTSLLRVNGTYSTNVPPRNKRSDKLLLHSFFKSCLARYHLAVDVANVAVTCLSAVPRNSGETTKVRVKLNTGKIQIRETCPSLNVIQRDDGTIFFA